MEMLSLTELHPYLGMDTTFLLWKAVQWVCR